MFSNFVSLIKALFRIFWQLPIKSIPVSKEMEVGDGTQGKSQSIIPKKLYEELFSTNLSDTGFNESNFELNDTFKTVGNKLFHMKVCMNSEKHMQLKRCGEMINSPEVDDFNRIECVKCQLNNDKIMDTVVKKLLFDLNKTTLLNKQLMLDNRILTKKLRRKDVQLARLAEEIKKLETKRDSLQYSKLLEADLRQASILLAEKTDLYKKQTSLTERLQKKLSQYE